MLAYTKEVYGGGRGGEAKRGGEEKVWVRREARESLKTARTRERSGRERNSGLS